MSVLIFAYGSNMCLGRISDRIESAVVVDVGFLRGHRLAMRKRGVDGSAKADAAAADRHHSLWGVIYQIARRDKPTLDQFESIGVGYDCVPLPVETPSSAAFTAYTYVARSEAIDDGLKPFVWYKDFLVRGARDHRLPEHYVRELEAIEAVCDPDNDRRRMNADLLAHPPRSP